GTDVVGSYPAFGRYVLALPRIEITIDDSSSGTVSFSKLATSSDINTYLNDNQLTLNRWDHFNPELGARIAHVSLPKIQLRLTDSSRGIFQARIPRHVPSDQLASWAKGIGMTVVSYDANTGDLKLQLL